jgi:hypothetical protein
MDVSGKYVEHPKQLNISGIGVFWACLPLLRRKLADASLAVRSVGGAPR